MKKIVSFSLMLLILSATHVRAAERQAKTLVKDHKEAELLLGRHVFTDHESFEEEVFFQHTVPGLAGITQEETLDGEEKAPYLLSAHYEVRINTAPCDFDRGFINGEVFLIGHIKEIRTQEFDFKGTISGLITNYNQIQRTGDFTFSRKEHPTYWTLQGIKDDSYPWDYWQNIDIYLTDNAGTLFDRKKALQQMEKKCKHHDK